MLARKVIVVALVGLFSLLSLGGAGVVWAGADQPPRVIPAESSQTTELRKAVDAEVDTLAPRLFELNDWMYKNPEPGFLEFEAAKALTEELAKHGFEVEMGVPGLDPSFDKFKIIGGIAADYSGPKGLPTAFKAKYKGETESPVIAMVVEYDSLRGNPPFHGCQHNMQGPTGIGAAIALAKVMEAKNVAGSVWVIGTPAEEVGPPSKAAMANAGYFDGVDFAFRSHGTSDKTLRYPGGFAARHIRQMKYTFHGESAHAQGAWEGRSALDAVFLLFHSVDMMREHSEPQFRFHGIVSDGGVAPNIVPQMASATMWIRHIIDETPVGEMSPRKANEMMDEKVEELDNMAKGAAMSTGTIADLDHYGAYKPGISVGAMNDLAFQYAVDYGGVEIGERNVPSQWEETGFATLLVPGVSVHIGTGDTPEVAGHSQDNADLSVSDPGHRSLVLTTKVMAASALRLFTDSELREKVKAEHAKWVEEYNK